MSEADAEEQTPQQPKQEQPKKQQSQQQVKLPVINRAKKTDSQPVEKNSPRDSEKSQVHYPPVNYYYVSGRYRILKNGIWSADLKTDYTSWLLHRRHLSEATQKIDDKGNTTSEQQYRKFRQRLKKIAEDGQKKTLEKRNEIYFSRIQKAKPDVKDSKDPFTRYVEDSYKKRYQYNRYLTQKNLNRENVLIESRIRAARPWATSDDFIDSYERLQKTGAHSKKHKRLEDLKALINRHNSNSNSTTSLNRTKSQSKSELPPVEEKPRRKEKKTRKEQSDEQQKKLVAYAPIPIQRPTGMPDPYQNKSKLYNKKRQKTEEAETSYQEETTTPE